MIKSKGLEMAIHKSDQNSDAHPSSHWQREMSFGGRGGG